MCPTDRIVAQADSHAVARTSCLIPFQDVLSVSWARISLFLPPVLFLPHPRTILYLCSSITTRLTMPLAAISGAMWCRNHCQIFLTRVINFFFFYIPVCNVTHAQSNICWSRLLDFPWIFPGTCTTTCSHIGGFPGDVPLPCATRIKGSRVARWSVVRFDLFAVEWRRRTRKWRISDLQLMRNL